MGNMDFLNTVRYLLKEVRYSSVLISPLNSLYLSSWASLISFSFLNFFAKAIGFHQLVSYQEAISICVNYRVK